MTTYNCSNFSLNPNFPLSSKLKLRSIETFHEALSFVEQFPYVRISNPDCKSLVIEEERGACSSKHAFLAQLAHENGPN